MTEKQQIMKKAVLFLTFNRLDVTKRVFEEIKKVKPPRLYIASDGARKDKRGEKEIVQETRTFILNNIDWECEVKTLFGEENLGCGNAVSKAITWFFEQEEDGIILEDDCLPSQSFFMFCEELLDYYKDNEKVMHISGDQFVPNFDNGASYYFAKNMHCWGWASWANRWHKYEFDLSDYDERNVEKFSENKAVQEYWLKVLKMLKNNQINTWDYQWMFSIIKNDGLNINPSVNLISNIGFGENSTHTSDANNPLSKMPIYEIEEIIHPKEIKIDQNAVDYIFKNHFGIDMESGKDNFWEKLKINTINFFK